MCPYLSSDVHTPLSSGGLQGYSSPVRDYCWHRRTSRRRIDHIVRALQAFSFEEPSQCFVRCDSLGEVESNPTFGPPSCRRREKRPLGSCQAHLHATSFDSAAVNEVEEFLPCIPVRRIRQFCRLVARSGAQARIKHIGSTSIEHNRHQIFRPGAARKLSPGTYSLLAAHPHSIAQ